MLAGAIDADEIMTVFSKMGVHIDRTEANQLLSRYCTVFDLISVLFAYVILGQKNTLISEPPLFF